MASGLLTSPQSPRACRPRDCVMKADMKARKAPGVATICPRENPVGLVAVRFMVVLWVKFWHKKGHWGAASDYTRGMMMCYDHRVNSHPPPWVYFLFLLVSLAYSLSRKDGTWASSFLNPRMRAATSARSVFGIVRIS